MSGPGQVVFEINIPPLHHHLYNQGANQRHRHGNLGARTRQDRLFTWTCSVAFSPPLKSAAAVDPFGLQNTVPDLTISLRCRPRAATTPVARQSLVDNHLCRYSRLLIIRSPPVSSPLHHHLHGPNSITLLDMPLRQAEVLLQGFQVEIDSSLLLRDDRCQLHVVLSTNDGNSNSNSNNNNNDNDNSNNSSNSNSNHINSQQSIPTSMSRQCEENKRVWYTQARKRSLDSVISTEEHQRLTQILESEIGADVQIMFAKDPFEMIWMDTLPTDAEIHAHSCILRTVNTETMRRLLNTSPPEVDLGATRADADRTRGPTEGTARDVQPGGREGHGDDGDSSGTRHDGQKSGISSSGQASASSSNDNNKDHQNRYVARNGSRENSSSGGGNSTPEQEAIRAIRFEDSPPAAVQAVVRYVYLGERPVVEANCGYTVKDLMALATFLGIEPLEDYCVELVLGLPQDCCCSESTEHRPTMCSRHSSCPAWQQGPRAGSGAGVGAGVRIRTKRHRGSPENMMMPPESMLQTLFAWGHRFPRIEQALIEVLVSDHGKILSKTEEKVLNRFKDHEAFERILVEMMMEQVRQRSEGRHARQ